MADSLGLLAQRGPVLVLVAVRTFARLGGLDRLGPAHVDEDAGEFEVSFVAGFAIHIDQPHYV